MNIGAVRQFVDLRRRRFPPAHDADTACYCHVCYCDFMVSRARQEYARIDAEVMHFLYELGMPR